MKAVLISAVTLAGVCIVSFVVFKTRSSERRIESLRGEAVADVGAVRAELRELQKQLEVARRENAALEQKLDRETNERLALQEKLQDHQDRVSSNATPGSDGSEASESEVAVDARDVAREAVLEAALAKLVEPGTPGSQKQKLWRQLVVEGFVNDALTFFEKRAEDEPGNADAQSQLGDAYIQKLLTVNDVEKSQWGMKADRAYDKALEANDHHWEARFSKAVSYSFFPPVFGFQSKAIGAVRDSFEATGRADARAAVCSDLPLSREPTRQSGEHGEGPSHLDAGRRTLS